MKGLAVLLIFSVLLSGCDLVHEEPPTSANSGYPLYIRNYFGNIENVHPKVLYFPSGWRGYEFWMAYTPYPGGKLETENPCIVVSHDGVNWMDPSPDVNPLAYPPPNGYNSDPHLVYDEQNDRLECWWRLYDLPTEKDALVRRLSEDGVTWSETEMVLPYGKPGGGRLSPSVWIEDGLYKMVYSNGVRLRFMTAPVGRSDFEWSESVELPIQWGKLHAWHHDVVLDEEGNWDIVVSAFPEDGTLGYGDLYYVKLKPDFSESVTPVRILERGKNKNDFDYLSLYRPSLIRYGDEYFLYYSTISKRMHRYITVVRGYSLFELRPFTYEERGVNVE